MVRSCGIAGAANNISTPKGATYRDILIPGSLSFSFGFGKAQTIAHYTDHSAENLVAAGILPAAAFQAALRRQIEAPVETHCLASIPLLSGPSAFISGLQS
jgi:hypothetical protein